MAAERSWEQCYKSGTSYLMADRLQDAEKEFRSAVALAEKLGPQDDRLLQSLNGLALTYFKKSDFEFAEPTYMRSLELADKIYSQLDPRVLPYLNGLAFCLLTQKKYSRALPFYDRSLSLTQQHRGRLHPDLTSILRNLGIIYEQLDRLPDAKRVYDHLVEIYDRSNPADSQNIRLKISKIMSRNPQLAPPPNQAVSTDETTVMSFEELKELADPGLESPHQPPSSAPARGGVTASHAGASAGQGKSAAAKKANIWDAFKGMLGGQTAGTGASPSQSTSQQMKKSSPPAAASGSTSQTIKKSSLPGAAVSGSTSQTIKKSSLAPGTPSPASSQQMKKPDIPAPASSAPIDPDLVPVERPQTSQPSNTASGLRPVKTSSGQSPAQNPDLIPARPGDTSQQIKKPDLQQGAKTSSGQGQVAADDLISVERADTGTPVKKVSQAPGTPAPGTSGQSRAPASTSPTTGAAAPAKSPSTPAATPPSATSGQSKVHGPTSTGGGTRGDTAGADASKAGYPQGVDADKHDQLIGAVIENRYKIETFIGAGGMSLVYKGTHLLMGKPVAIKVMQSHVAEKPELLQRFQQEARAASSLHHPNIASAHDFGMTSDGILYLVMEYVQGKSLEDLIKDLDHIPVERCLPIFEQVCDALAYAHETGLLHRDLKPSNIMLVNTGAKADVVKIVDFGLAKFMEGGGTEVLKLTRTGEFVGSPLYTSPEQLRAQDLDARSDIYSFGLVLYECLTGRTAITGETYSEVLVQHFTETPQSFTQVRPGLTIPKALEKAVFKSLEKEPGKRQASMKELKQELRAAMGR